MRDFFVCIDYLVIGVDIILSEVLVCVEEWFVVVKVVDVLLEEYCDVVVCKDFVGWKLREIVWERCCGVGVVVGFL